MSRGGGAVGLGEALEDRVRPLVKGGELKGLEGADGQTGGGGGGGQGKKIKTGETVRCFTDFGCVEQCMMGAEQLNGRWGHGQCVDVNSNNRKHPSNELKQQHHLLATVGTTPQKIYCI